MALSGLAMAEELTLTLPEASDYTWVPGSNASGIGGGVTAEIVTKWATYIDGLENPNGGSHVGWYAGTGQGHEEGQKYDGNIYSNDISFTSDNSFSFQSRPGLSGEYVAMGVELTSPVDSIDLTFDIESGNAPVKYSLWAWVGLTAVSLAPLTSKTGAVTEISATYSGAELRQGTTVYAIWEANYRPNTTIKVSNIAMSANVVPDPTTATLSLLALAGLAARRR